MILSWLACAVPHDGEEPAPAHHRPILGGGLAVDDAGVRWVSDVDRDRVLLVDPAGDRVGTVALPAGSAPNRLEVGADHAVVALRGAGAVAVVDRAALSRVIVPVCAEPRGVDVLDDDTAWVACADGVLARVDLARAEVVAAHRLETDLRDVVADGDTLHVTRFRAAELLRVDAATGQVLDRARPPTVDGDTMPVPPDLDPFSPYAAWRLRPHPQGGVVMLHLRGGDGPIDTRPSDARPTGYSGGGGCGGINHGAVTWFPEEGEPRTSLPLDGVGVPVDLAVRPDGTLDLVTTASAEGVVALHLPDPFAAGEECATFEAVGHGTDVHGEAVEWTEAGPVFAHRGPFGIDGVPLVEEERDLGWDLFHRTTSADVACVSCHPEGHEDGRTWRFVAEGSRRTQELAGVGSTAPFHWAGELATLDALLAEVHVRRMGAAFVEEGAAESLRAFLDAVPPLRPPAGDPDAIEAGRGVYAEAGCDDCHGAGASPASHDVGTGGAFQAPRLAGVAYRLPLMHDGCAATMDDRFSVGCGGGAHGDTADLDADAIDALIAFLESR